MSNTKTIPISDASFAQLKEHAMSLGLEVKFGTNTANLRGLIEAAFPGTTDITVADKGGDAQVAASPQPVNQPQTVGEVAPAPAVEPVIGTSYHFDPKVTVRIPPTKEPGGDRAVPVSVNGDTVLIKRGEDVELPYRFYEALEAALEKHYEYQTDEVTNRVEMIERESHAYEFSVKRLPPDDEVEAWRKRVADTFAP